MSELKNIRCPHCLKMGYLTEVKLLKEIPCDKSLTGYFTVPASEPWIHCYSCGENYKSIIIEGDQVRYLPI